jgi:MOSC domain-containing protein YiiM
MIAPFIRCLNIGTPKKETFPQTTITTGICKEPVPHAVLLGKTGLVGDGVHDTRHHGGEDKALCFYSHEHYPFWSAELGITMPPAAFGENITLEGLREDEVCIGDIFHLGEATVEISQPRQPCKVLAARYGRSDLVKMVINKGFTGWYSRVLVGGSIKKGDAMTLVTKSPQQVSITLANTIFHHDRRNRAGIEQVLAVAALSKSWQKSFQELLAACP